MVEAKDIKAAVALMKPKDMEPSGLPNLATLRKLVGDDTVTDEQVAEAVGLKPKAAPQPTASAAKANPKEPDEKPDDVTVTAAPVGAEQARRDAEKVLYEQATADLAAVCVKIADAEARRCAITDELDVLIVEKDKQSKLVERYAHKVSFAEGVKAIQAQTVKRLAETKQNTAVAVAALAANGMNVYPSKLDASLATRKRTPEQQQNYAKFVHQHATNRAAGIG